MTFSHEAFEGNYTGTYVIGEPGSGKTTLLEQQAVHHANLGHSVIVIEGHGDFSRHLLRTLPKGRRLLFVDPEDMSTAVGLNLFQVPEDPRLLGRMTTMAMELFRKVWDENWGPYIQQNLQMLALTAVDNPGLTLADIPHLFKDKDFRARIVANVTEPDLRGWWDDYEGMNVRDKRFSIDSTLNKVREWSMNPILKPIIGQERSSIDWRWEMDNGSLIIVRLPIDPVLGETVVSLLGTAIINQIRMAAFSRSDIPEEERKPVLLVCDEFHLFATPDFGEIFTGGRKFGIMTTVAHQNLTQIDDPKVKAAVLGAGQKVVFRVSGDDAIQLAKEFNHEPPEREITGYRPKQTPSVTVVEDIVRRGHPHQAVKAAADTYFVPFLRHPDDQRQEFRMSFPQYAGEYSGWDVHRGVEALNRYFYAAMHVDKQEKVRSITWAPPDLVTATLHLRHALGVGWILEELTPEDYEDFAHPGTGTHPRWEEFTGGKPRSADALTVMPFDFWLARQLANDIIAAREEVKPSSSESSFGQGVRLRQFLRAMTRVWMAVYETPVMSTGTEEEPIYGPTRPYADIENEITTRLVHLPSHTAMVRRGTDERELLMPPPLPAGEPIVVTNPWPTREEVLREINRRQAPPEEPQPRPVRNPVAPQPVLYDAPPPVRKPPPRR